MAKLAMFRITFEVHQDSHVFNEIIHMPGTGEMNVKLDFEDIVRRQTALKGRQDFGDVIYDLRKADVKNVKVKRVRGWK